MNQAATPQPAPQPGQRVVLDQVVADLRERYGYEAAKPIVLDLAARSVMGYEKYGCRLMTFNGRDALMDAYQENLDLLMYLGQVLQERGDKAPRPLRTMYGLVMRLALETKQLMEQEAA